MAVVLLASMAAYYLTSSKCFQWVGTVRCAVSTSEKLVALSFDDGPTQVGVDAVLPILAKHKTKATFFLIGREVLKHPALARKIASAGHEIGNHSYSHEIMVGRSRREYDREISVTDKLLRDIGAQPRLFRPPGGKRLIGLPLAVRRHGYTMVTWSVADRPWSNDTRDGYAERILQQVKPGAIILMHPMQESFGASRDALPIILKTLERRGYRVVTVSELLAKDSRPLE